VKRSKCYVDCLINGLKAIMEGEERETEFGIIEESGRNRTSNDKRANRRSKRRVRHKRRLTSKSKLLYFDRAKSSNRRRDKKKAENKQTEIYDVVLQTLWASNNFRERFVGLDDPSRGRYKWQHNCPKGMEAMNIFIALKDIFLQYHNNSYKAHERNKRRKERQIEWLNSVESFLNVMKFGTEGFVCEKKDCKSLESCFISTRRVMEPTSLGEKPRADSAEAVQESAGTEKDLSDQPSKLGDTPQHVDEGPERLQHEDDIFDRGYTLVVSYLDREDVILGQRELFIPLSRLQGIAMREINHNNMPHAQIRIKYGHKARVYLLLPMFAETDTSDGDAVTPDLLVKGLQTILGGSDSLQTDEYSNGTAPEGDVKNGNPSPQIQFGSVHETMFKVYTSRMNRLSDILFDILASLYCCHHGISDTKSIVRGLNALSIRHKIWWTPCVIKGAAKENLESEGARPFRQLLSDKDAAFSVFVQELFVTWKDFPGMAHVNFDHNNIWKQKKRTPAPFLPPGAISFWHDLDVVDVLDIFRNRSIQSWDAATVIRQLLQWRAVCTDLNESNPRPRYPRFHLLQRPPTFLVRLKWPANSRSWPAILSDNGPAAIWKLFESSHFKIDLLQIFDSVGAKKSSLNLPNKDDTMMYQMKQIVCFSVTGEFYAFVFSRTGGTFGEWYLIDTNGVINTAAFSWSDMKRLCKHRKAFPELVFFEDCKPGLYASVNERRARLISNSAFSLETGKPDASTFGNQMNLVPSAGDSTNFYGQYHEENSDVDSDSFDNMRILNGYGQRNEKVPSDPHPQQWCSGCIVT
jgi:hypothetical protein